MRNAAMTDPAAPVGLPKDTTHFPGDDCDPPHLDMSTVAAPVGLDLEAFPCERPDHRCPFPDGACFKEWRCLRYSSENDRKAWAAGAPNGSVEALLDLVSRQQGALRRALERLPDICEHIIFDEAGDEHHYVYCEGCGAHELPHGMPPDKTDACWAETERIALRSLLPREPKP